MWTVSRANLAGSTITFTVPLPFAEPVSKAVVALTGAETTELARLRLHEQGGDRQHDHGYPELGPDRAAQGMEIRGLGGEGAGRSSPG